jgi:hypothetical protein
MKELSGDSHENVDIWNERNEADREWSITRPPIDNPPAIKADADEREARIIKRLDIILMRFLPVSLVERASRSIYDELRETL